MRISNVTNLPAPIYDAILANPYSRGTSDISVTDLIDPPQLVSLRELHSEELSSDAADLIWSLLGQAMHSVLERSGHRSEGGVSEQRLYTTVEGWVVSGQFDYMDGEGVLWDWKFVSTYEVINGIKDSRAKQLNLYAVLSAANGVEPSGLRVGFIFRDWSKRTAENDRQYPQSQAQVVELPLWDLEESREYLKERVLAHQEARRALKEGEPMTECTPEERWAKPDTWAVIKKGNKRATRVLPSQEQADLYAAEGKDFRVEARKGESTRCKTYCPVLQWCAQGQKEVGVY